MFSVENSQASPLNIGRQISPLLLSDFQSQIYYAWVEVSRYKEFPKVFLPLETTHSEHEALFPFLSRT